MWKVNFDKNAVTFHQEISVSYTIQECENVTTPFIQLLLYYLSSGGLQKVKNKRKYQTYSSRSGCGRLQEVASYRRLQIVIWHGNFWYFVKLVTEERWLLTREVATGVSAIIYFISINLP